MKGITNNSRFQIELMTLMVMKTTKKKRRRRNKKKKKKKKKKSASAFSGRFFACLSLLGKAAL